jgi:hypothetical protein
MDEAARRLAKICAVHVAARVPPVRLRRIRPPLAQLGEFGAFGDVHESVTLSCKAAGVDNGVELESTVLVEQPPTDGFRVLAWGVAQQRVEALELVAVEDPAIVHAHVTDVVRLPRESGLILAENVHPRRATRELVTEGFVAKVRKKTSEWTKTLDL